MHKLQNVLQNLHAFNEIRDELKVAKEKKYF